MAVEQKRFSRRRQIREDRNPTGEVKVADEAPSLDELEIGSEVEHGMTGAPSEPDEDLSVGLEHPPGPAVMWQRIRQIEKKVEIMWMRSQNQRRQSGANTISWKCKGSPDRPDLGCDFVMENTPPGMPKDPPLVCPKHGLVPFDPVS